MKAQSPNPTVIIKTVYTAQIPQPLQHLGRGRRGHSLDLQRWRFRDGAMIATREHSHDEQDRRGGGTAVNGTHRLTLPTFSLKVFRNIEAQSSNASRRWPSPGTRH
jgi:hypothetical protein